MKENLINYLKKQDDFNNLDLDKLLQKPKVSSQGDLSLPMFILAKKMNLSPQDLSKKFETKLNLEKPDFLEKIESIGPFLNFYFNTSIYIKSIFENIQSENIFNIKIDNPQKILIEFPSPNTNKALHIGHVRNMFLGNSISNILEKVGHKVIRTNMNNNRGIAICKSMLSYKLFGDNSTPESMKLKPDEFVSYYYVLYGKKNKESPELELDKKAQEMLVNWEAGEKETLNLWNKLQKWVMVGYKETYKNFKLKKFDKEYFESEIYKKGKDLILKEFNNKIEGFEKEDDGAIVFNFKDKTYGKKYLLRGDGTSLYITQDLYLASLKEKEFSPDKSIFVVGQEQKYHFEVLFKILDKIGFSKVDNNYHLAYGYVYDKNGKKFSSRLGNTLGADETLNLIIDAAKKNLIKKDINNLLSKNEINKRSKIIGFSALAFFFLKVNPKDDIKFDIDKAISFEGETGPYVQYTYARIQSILRKANFDFNKIDFNINYSLFGEKEINLIKILNEYELNILETVKKYKISQIANYLIKLSQSFNDFYQNVNILKSKNQEEKKARLILLYLVSLIIKDALSLYDIEVLDEM